MSREKAGPPLLFLMGPTAVGKTDVAVELVASLPLEIISVDSAMVYRGMNIGTGKPAPEVLARAPHRLIDIREPGQTYSAAQFVKDATHAISEIREAGRVPLLVGGTGLYFRTLRRGLSPLPAADPPIRAALEAEADRLGLRALHARLAEVDPESAGRIHPNDPQRIQRALEVYALTGRPMSALLDAGRGHAQRFEVDAVSLEPAERGWLHARIAARFEDMLERGLVEEVAALKQSGRLKPGMPALRAVGYRQVWRYLRGDCDLDELKAGATAATRQLARRQLTWLRKEAGVTRFDCSAPSAAGRVTTYFARHFAGA
ncbi:MAG TPA: tRNA (adenosine(37)-N6)-dimethylallyltransferase MiaA [Gammaproteobacteria bacterium]|nr:tRNA (adenosine(37)-N6)-dimethylallyltransferase MiaA [Gammaproteobacteria bacterium]